MDTTALFFTFVIVICVVGAFFVLRSSAKKAAPKCPSCGRARVPGQERCLFCGSLFQCPDCGRAWVPGRNECPFCGYNPALETFAPQPLPIPLEQASRLTCLKGPQRGKEVLIHVQEFTIGRREDNMMQVEGELVSRQHAVVSFQDGQYILYDRESTNGTWVNGRRIAQHVLQPGDQIQIGPSIFVFQLAGAPVPLVPARIPTPGPPPAELIYDFGDYERTETIGSGGAATVYKGICRRNGTTVAIKVLHTTDPYLRDKFQKEGQIGEALRHPHIARIYGGGRSNGVFYIVMEYVDDRSLRERITPGQPMPLEAVIPIIGQTCDALQYAHSMGVYHRDIKPENIMFSSTAGVKLVDFGIAKLASTVTRTAEGMIIGTPYYMSYEQARGWQDIDGRSDIYSLGVVLYETVTGCVPFTGASLSVVHQHITKEPTPPRRLNSSLPSQIEEVVMRAMSKDRNRRFQTAEEMARALGYTEPMSTGVVYGPAMPLEARPEYVPGQAQLVVLKSGKTISVAAGITPLCRRDIDPDDLLISREHARIVWQGGHYWLEDHSTNGTFVNDKRIFARTLLQSGDEIRVGKTTLRFET